MTAMYRRTRSSGSSGAHDETRSNGKHVLARDERGSAIIEFALVLPMLMIVLVGIIVFGIAFNNQITLTAAANMAAQALSTSRGQTTNPCTTTAGPVYSVAPTLSQANLKFTITISPPSGGTGATYTLASSQVSPSCAATSTTTAPATDLVQGDVASVTVTYPCNLAVYGHNYAPNCTLTAQTAEVIQ